MEVVYLSHRALTFGCRIVLLSGSGLGHTYQPDYGATRLFDCSLEHAGGIGAPMETLAIDAVFYLVFNRRLLLAILAF